MLNVICIMYNSSWSSSNELTLYVLFLWCRCYCLAYWNQYPSLDTRLHNKADLIKLFPSFIEHMPKQTMPRKQFILLRIRGPQWEIFTMAASSFTLAVFVHPLDLSAGPLCGLWTFTSCMDARFVLTHLQTHTSRKALFSQLHRGLSFWWAH